MRKNLKSMTAVCMTCGLVMTQMAGCGQNAEPAATVAAEDTAAQENKGQATESTVQQADQAEPGTVTVTLGEGGEKSVTYDAEDMNAQWDADSATGIVLAATGITVEGEGASAEGNTVVISQPGTYVVSGALEDGQIRIEAEKDALVHLVLNGVELSNQTTAPIYASEKCKVVLTLAEGTENVIGDTDNYQFAEGEDEPNAPVFAKGDLTINGSGKLAVQGNFECGIRSKGDLKVVSGTLDIQSEDDGLKGKDAVVIRGGQIDIQSGKDGIKANNDEDADKGYIWIDGGEITIAAEDDGIQAETALILNGGEITISDCQEGLAGKTVDILGGQIRAVAQDDGINSAGIAETEWEKMQDQDGVYTRIAGGEIWLDASADGIDSNGDLYMEGGTLYLSGPVSDGEGILDYNGTATITGGTVIAAGGSGMMQTFSEESTQNYLVVYYTEKQEAGTAVQLQSADGTVLAEYAPEKDFAAVILSSPELETGNTYQVVTGEESVEMAVSGLATISGTPSRGMGGPGGHGMGGCGGERPEAMTPPERGERPEGMTPPEDGECPEGMNPSERGKRQDGMGRQGRGQKPEAAESTETDIEADA